MRDLSYSKYKNVVAVGCSYTHGSHEDANPTRANIIPSTEYIDGKPPKTSFVRELAKLANIEFYNLGKNGLSFKFLLYYAFLWIQGNIDKVNDTLLIVGLTHRRRETFFNPRHKGKWRLKGIEGELTAPYVVPTRHTPLEQFKNTKWLRGEAERLDVTPEAYCNFTDILWNIVDDPVQRDSIDEMYMIMLQNYCNKIGLDILFIDTTNEAVRWPKYNLKDWREIVEPVFVWPDGSESWKHYLFNKDPAYKGEHPNYEDHVELGRLLYQYINI